MKSYPSSFVSLKFKAGVIGIVVFIAVHITPGLFAQNSIQQNPVFFATPARPVPGTIAINSIVFYKIAVPPRVASAITFSSLLSFNARNHSTDTIRKRKDTDGDGIVDSLDKCPDEKGVIQYDGCPVPDSDNDGIADDSDECPTIAGLLKYKGCPPGDKDGDKINDDEDKCPGVPGVARYDGCPVGDADKDGVNDDDDRCKETPGTKSNEGCPDGK